MTDDNLLPFCFPAVCRKKITAAFDGGRISSDGGVMLLAQADRRLGIAERLALAIPDARDPDLVVLNPGREMDTRLAGSGAHIDRRPTPKYDRRSSLERRILVSRRLSRRDRNG